MGKGQTPDEAIEKGDENFISLMIVKLVSKSTLPKTLAPFYAEFYGAMMLVLVITLTAGRSELAPLAIGSILMVMVFTYGHLSGGHFNPAVSFAVMMRGKLTPLRWVFYAIAQVIGGLCGAALGDHILPDGVDGPIPSYPDNELGSAFAAEFFFSFALCTTVLNTATTVSVGQNSFYGLAIGFTVLAGAITVGDISGAVFNPAVGTGLLVIAGEWSDIWFYWLAPMFGGFVAGVMFHLVNSDEDDIVFGKATEIKVAGAAVGAHVGKYRQSISSDMSTKDFTGRTSIVPGMSFRGIVEESTGMIVH
eukprot:CAMPEP_0194356368 /NCGR_PEP_ID=MMETSP0174-20130528/4036_1 /TAXON_ID=216777 /ORGANISM="Proboscia alata, Strain PI-D3" /LENGTH=305 /DNA_ID=CAMNT_0039125931 /DNA_START=84 /DNA_END=1001 /DNA_ORIENTATION=-